MFACGLVTTLGVAVYCNTTIRPESVRCALVACGVKYIRLLVTTLGIAVHCNTTIRLEFVRYTLMTCGQVFVYCSATTLSIVVHCDTASNQSPSTVFWQLSKFYPFVALA